MALVKSANFFSYYLIGRKFRVRTDHQPLKWLQKTSTMSARLHRWWVELEKFDFIIEYRAGNKHGNADALSRLLPLEYKTEEAENTNLIIHFIRNGNASNKRYKEDEDIKWIKNLIVESGNQAPPPNTPTANKRSF